ncbi:tetratricopeptide repeat protein [Thalassococcus sp. CAU 1522]|uniref:Tetratricopeptide repeat protein n=1 Tax=Thalassococcus arenae TaxID=2851652 RepID=A0ABS6NCD4_9RHOB|nr:tetratricopeptide repeat protein [Thalassococcus arenae]MBV2361687.1 tetratricopeptide repeat protein [Thalassococcus arenae]
MRLSLAGCVFATLLLAACSPGGLGTSRDTPFAPGLDPRGEAVDGLVVGHRLMEAGQYDQALQAFTRAAGEKGLTGEVLVALGSANLALGRLNQSETLLRRAVAAEPDWPEAWNNLGVVLIERGQTAEAAEIFRRAFALDNGESDSIRDNLRLALAKMENSDYGDELEQEYKLVRRGSGSYLIRKSS